MDITNFTIFLKSTSKGISAKQTKIKKTKNQTNQKNQKLSKSRRTKIEIEQMVKGERSEGSKTRISDYVLEIKLPRMKVEILYK